MAPPLPLRTRLGFFFGRADAIRDIAAAGLGSPVGVILVLLTAIARNYDQTWIGEEPFKWCLGNLFFPFCSGSLLFFFIHFVFVRRHLPPEKRSAFREWGTFLGLFWAAAPIAWLYAIPVERFRLIAWRPDPATVASRWPKK